MTGARPMVESTRAHHRNSQDRKSTRLNSSHLGISYAVFCLKKKKKKIYRVSGRTTYPASTQANIQSATSPGSRSRNSHQPRSMVHLPMRIHVTYPHERRRER